MWSGCKHYRRDWNWDERRRREDYRELTPEEMQPLLRLLGFDIDIDEIRRIKDEGGWRYD